MNHKYVFCLITLLYAFSLNAQFITLTPANATATDEVTLTFDAALGNGELKGASKVYAHHGAVLSGPNGTDWNLVIGNWGNDDGVGEMTKVNGSDDKWELTFSPSVIDHFNAATGTNIFRISIVFRNANGSIKGTIAPGEYGWGTVAANQDNFVNLNNSHFVSINSPVQKYSFIDAGTSIPITAAASAPVTSMKLFIDEGSGFVEQSSVNSGQEISYDYSPPNTITINVRIEATINGEMISTEKEYNIIVVKESEIASIPEGIEYGINYHEENDQRVTLALEAPGKDFVYVAGDFTNWLVSDEFKMKKSPDGEGFWIDIEGLTAQQEYVFKYVVDGEILIADPYADKIADPWHDEFIEESVYPNLPEYDKTEFGIASVLQTGQTDYDWAPSELSWEKPDVNHLIIYELHIRDFLASHSYTDLIDTLSYLEKLGVNAIELMPVNEFEGNDSWGYNPSFFFAPDKYYGSGENLKKFIEASHQKGMAVIMDIVLNHAYGENPMVQLYIDDNYQITNENPWFNRNYVGQYQWGYDFNHESSYTQRFVDRVNSYWLDEYHFDGFRFDFTKGFTNFAPNGSIDGFDQSRIDILKRMSTEIRKVDPTAFIILEHWAPSQEEAILAQEGMKMWRNKGFDYFSSAAGFNEGNFSGMSDQSHVTFMDSHDERRIAERVLTEGSSKGSYNIRQPEIMYERVKQAAAFAFLQPGPKMIWQFDELGYDIHIDFNGRIGRKPLPWGAESLKYYEDSLRQFIYDAYAGILDVRNTITPQKLAVATIAHKLSGTTRRLSYDTDDIDLVVIGNFGMDEESVDPRFSQTGNWYDYFSGEEMMVTNTTIPVALQPGEWHIYTTQKLSEGKPGVVEIYSNPVTITPFPFTKNDEITITFNASIAHKDGTQGLVGAEKVYFHSGLVKAHPDSTTLENVVGTFMDDGVGVMTNIGNDMWEMKLTVSDYYDLLEDEEAYKIGMYFRDGPNENVGKGFRNSTIYFNIDSDLPFVTIRPSSFTATDEITITFNAGKGNRELASAEKIYMHSSMGIVDTQTPAATAWNFAVGNWGMDDGIGQMTRVAGSQNLWEITLTPKDYYGLPTGAVPYWFAGVFRSSDGNTKGTGTPGNLENGFIADNLDFFIRNQITTSIHSVAQTSNVSMYPNPTTGIVYLRNITEPIDIFIYNSSGKLIYQQIGLNQQTINISDFSNGVYFYRIEEDNKVATGKIIKNNL